MPLYLKISENINETTRHLKFHYISILTNFLRTVEEYIVQHELRGIELVRAIISQLVLAVAFFKGIF